MNINTARVFREVHIGVPQTPSGSIRELRLVALENLEEKSVHCSHNVGPLWDHCAFRQMGQWENKRTF